MAKKIICIIPARGGSKRLPHKNVIDFLGKPIIAYTIEAALQSAFFERIVVSTEDVEIAEVALRFGAQVSKRPVSLATDASTVVEVCSDLLEREKMEGRIYDILCCLYATAPLRKAEDIVATLKLIEPGVCNFAMAVTKYVQYAHQALRLTEAGFLEAMWPEYIKSRSEKIGRLLVGNGSTYAVTIEAFKRCKSFYGPRLRGHIMPRSRSVDIDDQEDLEMALYFAQKLDFSKAD